jgi:hypothetical protein
MMIVTISKPTATWPGTPQHGDQTLPAAYLEALQTANAFLWAWLTRDADGGLRLISDRLRSKINDDSWVRQFMVGLSNPHHQAFEISHGRRQTSSRYAFPVILYELYDGEPMGASYRGILEVAKQGNVWRVDRLPHGPDNR